MMLTGFIGPLDLLKISFLDKYNILCVFTNKRKVIWDAKKSLKDKPIWNILKEGDNFRKLCVSDGVLIYRFSNEENDYFDICPDLIYMEGKKI